MKLGPWTERHHYKIGKNCEREEVRIINESERSKIGYR